MDILMLRDTDFTSMYNTADAYDRLSKAFSGHAGAWSSGVDGRVRESGWTGDAGDAAGRSLYLTTSKLQAAQVELDMIGEILRGGADALLLAQSKLRQALADGQAAGISVNECGVVTAPPLTGADRHDPDARSSVEAQQRDISDRISAALTDAGAADRETADRLRHYTANARNGSGLNLQSATMDRLNPAGSPLDSLLKAMPKSDASPAAVSAWWKSLTPDEQQRLIRSHPDLLGNRDGIPSAARDQANRIVLPRLIDQYRNKPNLSDDDRTKLDGFCAIQKKLNDNAGKQPLPLLLGVSDEGQGRGILSWGNPDTAQNVCAYVPGLGTTLSSVGGKDADRAFNVWDAANRADGRSATASIVWLGYDPPPGIDQLADGDLRTADVMSTDRAERGAASYDQFLSGLRATHDGPPAHITALGHSYGSTTVGLAAQRPGGTGADDIILVGSPGTGADNASQLNVGRGHVWVGDAENDPVSHLPSKGALAANGLGGPLGGRIYDVGGGGNQIYFGTDPASQEFGANRFKVADGPSLSFESHSNYMEKPRGDTGTQESVINIGQIVTGNYNRVTGQVQR
ncbi:alpha/beta hydrolase [Kitasatospora sp. NPDC002227]|uniref:alpha/beta hydrolase n=1 Tax=Kitasatospora sp. NPDC002227 TaxID=3154773 RepID=UPI003332E43A